MERLKTILLITSPVIFPVSGCHAQIEKADKPNIVCILVDDMGWRDVGFMGSEYYETPNLDKLSRQGMVFTNAYAAASNCAPSRAALMTGQWSPRHGIYTVESSERGQSKHRKLIPVTNTTVLDKSHYTMARAMKDAGYVTCASGKWHLSNDPLTYGFDVNIGGSAAGHPASYYSPYKNVALEAPSDGYYLTTLIMDKTLEFLGTAGDKPFFLYYAPYAVHTPIQPVSELLPKYANKPGWKGQANADYATMVENLDKQIGRLVEYLDSTGKLDNTFILFTSDNGGHYGITRQLPLRSGKGSYYEGGIRVPLFAVWPGKIKNQSVSDVPVTNLDFFPTFAELAGAKISSSKVLDGQSLIPLLKGSGRFEERPLFWHFPIYLESYLKEGDPTQDPLFRTRPGSAVRLGDYKLIRYYENNDLELYNLADDVSESKNLATSEPEKLTELLKILDDWREKTGAPVPSKQNPEYIDN
jgi:arylsulfatase A-like enzyme